MNLPTPLIDAHGRVVRYLRLSVTDRCNLRCVYCTNTNSLQYIPHEKILSYEELLALIAAAVSLGIDKVRLTGGEPFARKGFIPFLEQIRKRHPDLNLRITTNATLLAPHVRVLKDLGLNALNISFDTFQPETFKRVTGIDAYAQALQGLHAALESGIAIKINAVALKGVNDHELPAFIDFAKSHAVDVRFIEYMPLGGSSVWTEDTFWPADSILAAARELATLTPVRRKEPEPAPSSPAEFRPDDSGPARLFTIAGGKGRLGLITPLSSHFCGSCNRLRITSDGRLRTCLFSDKEYAFRDMLRDPAQGIEAVVRLMQMALQDKPLGYQLLQARADTAAVISRSMSSIGG